MVSSESGWRGELLPRDRRISAGVGYTAQAVWSEATKVKITVFGLTLSSSWGNGHATPYRAIIRALDRMGHRSPLL